MNFWKHICVYICICIYIYIYISIGTEIDLICRVRYSPSVSNDDLCNRRSDVVVQQQHRAVRSQTCMRPHYQGHHKFLSCKYQFVSIRKWLLFWSFVFLIWCVCIKCSHVQMCNGGKMKGEKGRMWERIALYIGKKKPRLEHQQAQQHEICHEEFELYPHLLTHNNSHTCMFMAVVLSVQYACKWHSHICYKPNL
jgi:hypothetical protein